MTPKLMKIRTFVMRVKRAVSWSYVIHVPVPTTSNVANLRECLEDRLNVQPVLKVLQERRPAVVHRLPRSNLRAVKTFDVCLTWASLRMSNHLTTMCALIY